MFYVVPLTIDEVRKGVLMQITDALSNEFSRTAELAKVKGFGDKEEMLIHFDNSSTNENFHDTWGEDIIDVLYINDAAKQVAERAGLVLEITETAASVPSHVGLAGRMYRFV